MADAAAAAAPRPHITIMAESPDVMSPLARFDYECEHHGVDPSDDRIATLMERRPGKGYAVISVSLFAFGRVPPYVLRNNGFDDDKLYALRSLFIESCPVMRRLPRDFGHCLCTLERLHFQDVPLEALPPSMGCMERLKDVMLTNTRLTRLPPTMVRLLQLQKATVYPKLRIVGVETRIVVSKRRTQHTLVMLPAEELATRYVPLTGNRFRLLCAAFGTDPIDAVYAMWTCLSHRQRWQRGRHALPPELLADVARRVLDSAGEPVWNDPD